MTVKEKLMGVSKTKKMMIAGVAVLLVGGIGGTVYASNQSQQKIVAEKQETLDTTTTKLADLNKKVQTLFDSKDSNFLAKGVTEQQINELKEQLAKETKPVTKDTIADTTLNSSGYTKVKTDVSSLLNKAENLSQSQTAINGLFTETKESQALNGTDVKKDLPITNDLTQATLDEVKTDIEAFKESTSFDKTCLELIKVAQDQVSQISKAKTEVAKVFKDGKVTSTDKKAYDTAKKEVDKIKNAKAKKDLSDQLAKVKTDIDKKEKAETDKKAEASNTEPKAENKATADATQANQQADNGSTGGATASNQKPSYNDAGTGGYADNGYTPSYDTGSQGTGSGNAGGGSYTPPANNGSTGGGSSTGGNQGGSSSTGGGQSNNNDNDIDWNDVQESENNNHNGSNDYGGW